MFTAKHIKLVWWFVCVNSPYLYHAAKWFQGSKAQNQKRLTKSTLILPPTSLLTGYSALPCISENRISLCSLSKVTAKLYDHSCECQKLIQVQNRLLGLVSREFIKKRRWRCCHFHFRLISVYATLWPKDRQYLWKLKHISVLELLLLDISEILRLLKGIFVYNLVLSLARIENLLQLAKETA